MIPPEFDYAAPESLDEAIRLLADGRRGREAARRRALAAAADEAAARGAVAARRPAQGARPPAWSAANGTLRIGAMTTPRDAPDHDRARAARRGGEHDRRPAGAQPRARSAARSPTATRPPTCRRCCSPPRARSPCRARAASARSPRRDLFQDYLTTALEPDEVITEVRVPALDGYGYGYQKFTRRAEDWAMVGVCALVKATDGTCEDVRVGLTHMGATPLRADGGRGGAARPAARRRAHRARRPSRPPRAPIRPATSTPRPTTSGTWRACCPGARSTQAAGRTDAGPVRRRWTGSALRRRRGRGARRARGAGLPGRSRRWRRRLPGRRARAAAAARGRGRRRQDRGGEGARRGDRRAADPPPVPRGHRPPPARSTTGTTRASCWRMRAAEAGARAGRSCSRARVPAPPAAARGARARRAGRAADRRDRPRRRRVRGVPARVPLRLPGDDPRAGHDRAARPAARRR